MYIFFFQMHVYIKIRKMKKLALIAFIIYTLAISFVTIMGCAEESYSLGNSQELQAGLIGYVNANTINQGRSRPLGRGGVCAIQKSIGHGQQWLSFKT